MELEKRFFEGKPRGEIPDALKELLEDLLNSAGKNIVIVGKFSDGVIRVMSPLNMEDIVRLLEQGIELRKIVAEKKIKEDEDDGGLGFDTIPIPEDN